MKTALNTPKNSKIAWLTITLLTIFASFSSLNRVEGAECIMARQLQDPSVRSNYISIVESSKLPKNGDFCGTSHIPAVSRQQTAIDALSMECISCHDGTIGRNVYYKMVKSEIPETTETLVLQITHSAGSDAVSSEAPRTIDTTPVTARTSHAIGTDFTKYNCNPEFNSWESLPDEMVLMDGEISCATCHNLLSKNRLYLSVDMSRSGLCFACHRK